ncbi:enoyl-CoA hydratase/isomerase family protein [Paraburkholderia sp. J41]|uniref:enoyl-CoA hydratase/isomerase family protein n=1 Tax=Paraburkholderia sp. J41 TaxID=2805433 RepID=UPI002AC32D6C|nr:enoyl-CoA hydratase/isomerase family protein [Paraburkholderia sp. J41]
MSTIRIDRQASHWTITLDRADKLNALSAELVEALLAAFDDAARQHVPLVTLQGEGRCFSAGFDMTDVETQSEGDLLLRFVRIETLLQTIASSPCFTIALAHGRNFGAGADLVAACNLRVAAPGTTFRMPGLKFGLVLGTARFARIVGQHAAKRILESAMTFDAERAHALGFIEHIATPEEHADVVGEALARLEEIPPASRALLFRALDAETPDIDLAALVRSAAEPGIHARIAAYRRAASKASDG